MTYVEISRRRALNSVEFFLSALDEYRQQKHEPRDRHGFVKGDGILRIQNDPDVPIGLSTDLARLCDALNARSAEDVATALRQLVAADHAVPFDVETDYRALYVELFNKSREYVEICSLAKPAQLSDQPALSNAAAATYEILLDQPAHRAMTGPELLKALQERGICIEQSTLTSRIVPALKPYGLESTPRIGYRIPPSHRPTHSE